MHVLAALCWGRLEEIWRLVSVRREKERKIKVAFANIIKQCWGERDSSGPHISGPNLTLVSMFPLSTDFHGILYLPIKDLSIYVISSKS